MKYKYLTQRDIILNGDEYRSNYGTWEEIEPEYVGKRKGELFSHYTRIRRRRE